MFVLVCMQVLIYRKQAKIMNVQSGILSWQYTAAIQETLRKQRPRLEVSAEIGSIPFAREIPVRQNHLFLALLLGGRLPLRVNIELTNRGELPYRIENLTNGYYCDVLPVKYQPSWYTYLYHDWIVSIANYIERRELRKWPYTYIYWIPIYLDAEGVLLKKIMRGEIAFRFSTHITYSQATFPDESGLSRYNDHFILRYEPETETFKLVEGKGSLLKT